MRRIAANPMTDSPAAGTEIVSVVAAPDTGTIVTVAPSGRLPGFTTESDDASPGVPTGRGPAQNRARRPPPAVPRPARPMPATPLPWRRSRDHRGRARRARWRGPPGAWARPPAAAPSCVTVTTAPRPRPAPARRRPSRPGGGAPSPVRARRRLTTAKPAAASQPASARTTPKTRSGAGTPHPGPWGSPRPTRPGRVLEEVRPPSLGSSRRSSCLASAAATSPGGGGTSGATCTPASSGANAVGTTITADPAAGEQPAELHRAPELGGGDVGAEPCGGAGVRRQPEHRRGRAGRSA